MSHPRFVLPSRASSRSLRALLLAAIGLLAPVSSGEVPNLPATVLHSEPVQIEVTVLSVEEKQGPGSRTTSLWHRVRVDRVFVGEGIEPGNEVAVVSQVHRVAPGTTGSAGMRGDFGGRNGLPIKGDRARLFAHVAVGSRDALQPAFPNGWQQTAPTVAFVAADDEYRSEITMPLLASLAERNGIVRPIQSFSSDASNPDRADPSAKTGLTKSHSLRYAEALVVFMRFGRLAEEHLKAMVVPTEGGLPLIAFRTSTHAFAYPDDSPHAAWNAGYGERFLGTAWRFHHGHGSRTRILPPEGEAANHPIVAGLAIPPEGLVVRSWLYHVEPLPDDCRVLLWGEAIESEAKDAPARQPIVWTRELPRVPDSRRPKTETAVALPPQRIAVTTLGHPADFASPEVRLLALGMIAWATGRDGSLDGAAVAAIRASSFEPPSTR